MKTKTSIILILFLCLNFNLAAQTNYDEIQTGLIDLTGWIQKLNTEIKSIFKKERKNRLIRNLGYLYIDLDQLSYDKQNLLNLAIENNSNGTNSLTLNEIEEYKTSVKTISKRLNKVVLDLNDQYKIKGDSIVNKIRVNLVTKKFYELNQIAGIISNESEFDKEKISESVQNAVNYINGAKQAVADLRSKLQEIK